MFSSRSESSPEFIPLSDQSSERGRDLEEPMLDPIPQRRSVLLIIFDGPLKPQDNPVSRISKLEFIEELPDTFRSRYATKLRVLLFACYILFWFGLCYSMLAPYLRTEPRVANGFTEILSLTCGQSDDFWFGKNERCGIFGEFCPRLNTTMETIIRCPASCELGKVYTLVPLGDQRIKYKPYVVGGGRSFDTKLEEGQITKPYRGDSHPCMAALHAGLISSYNGGCARVSFQSKDQTLFESSVGSYFTSFEFKSFFQSSYYFKSDPDDEFINCHDPRYPVTIVNILLGIPIVFLASAAVVFWTISFVGFWTLCLIEDPIININPADSNNFAHLITKAAERFMPTCFILYVLWHFSVKYTLSQEREKTKVIGDDYEKTGVSYLMRVILWYPTFWVGILINITFDRLPIDRLKFSGLTQQPGGVISMISVLGFIVTCALIQGYKVWKSGKFAKYLKFYFIIMIGIILIAQIPNTKLHLHHYIIGIVLLPGCSTKGKTALLFSGVLLGMFLSGASRWGLASIIDTIAQWTRGDPIGTVKPPDILGYDNSTGLLNFKMIPTGDNYTSIYEKFSSVSLLVNDIEAYVEDKVSTINLKDLFGSDEIKPLIQKSLETINNTVSIYLRIARKVPDSDIYSDFSNAAILNWPSGDLKLPDPGFT